MAGQGCHYAKTEHCSEAGFYRRMMEEARDIVVVFTPDGYVVDANQAAIHAYGYSLDELLGQHVQRFRAPALRGMIDEQLKMAHDEGILFRTVHLRRTGEEFPVEVGSRQVRLPQGDLIVSMVRDISNTLAIEADLQRKKKKLQELYEELATTHEELTAADEELRQQFDELLHKEQAIRRQNYILQMLHEIALGLVTRHDTGDLLQRILAGATELMGTSHGFINLVDPSKSCFFRSHVLGIYEQDALRIIPIDQGISGIAYRTGKPAAINDYAMWRKTSPASPQFPELRAVVDIPLKAEGEIIGMIGVAYCEVDRNFGAEEIEALSRFAELASLALNNARLMTAVKNELQERQVAEAALQASEAKYRAIFAAANDGICIYHGATGAIIDINDRACAIYGYSREELLSDHFRIIGTGKTPYGVTEARQRLQRAAAGEPQLFEWKNKHRDGYITWVEVSLKRVSVGQDDCVVAIVRDISDRKGQEERVRQMAYHDYLTGMPNRAYVQECLAQELQRMPEGEAAGAVMFVDMDDLKMINDAMGHACGDEVIKKIGAILVAAAGEEAVVARIGGDEFIVLLPGERERERVANIAERMVRFLGQEYEVGELMVHMSASIGVALYPADGCTADDLFKRADLALYDAKGSGKNTWRFYEDRLQTLAYENMMLKHGLREAVQRQELSLHYQPLVDAETGRIMSFEALARWTNPVYGAVPPGRFIPLAEENDTIQLIGQWVIQEVCAFARKVKCVAGEEIGISMNVSPRQLVAENFISQIQDAISRAGIRAQQLEIEITESALIDSMDDSIEKLLFLRQLGVCLSLDDFGTGYSSLTYLRRLPVSKLKLDKSFIEEMTRDAEQVQFIRSIIEMANGMGLAVIAEGVETAEQVEQLLHSRCTLMQGFYFSRPLPEGEALALLTQTMPVP